MSQAKNYNQAAKNYNQAKLISKQVSERRELKELTEQDRNQLRNWIERIVLGLSLSFE